MAELAELIGQVLDETYLLDQLLDQGGMGAVFLATHLGTTRPVALKIIAPQLMANEEFIERFRREAEAAGRLRHPNVVNVTDFGFANIDGEQMAYLVMEYLDGSTLGRHLAQGRPLALNFVVDVVEQVCLAIEKAHQQGIIHRDLKPDNIWMEPNGRGGFTVKVLDFGLAKLRDVSTFSTTDDPTGRNLTALRSNSLAGARLARPSLTGKQKAPAPAAEEGTLRLNIAAEKISTEKTLLMNAETAPALAESVMPETEGATLRLSVAETDHGAASSTDVKAETKASGGRSTVAAAGLTHAGEILGTPLYMSPEQCLGEVLDTRSDIYSLGVITWQMLAGEPLFTGSISELITQHTREKAPSLREKRRDLPPAVASLVMSSLSKNPEDRPATASAFANALRATAEGELQVLREARFHYTNLLPLLIGFSLMIYAPFILLTGLISWLLMPPQSDSRDALDLPLYLASVGSWLLTFVLIVIAGRFKNAACSLVAEQLRSTAHHEIRLRPLLAEFLSYVPALTRTLLLSLKDILTGIFSFRFSAWRRLVANSIFPTIVVLEGKSGREALDRSAQLTARLPHLANAFQVREIGISLLSVFMMPLTMIITAVVMGAPLSGMINPPVRMRLFFLFFAWYFALMMKASISAFPQALFYFRARRAGGEAVDEITSQTLLAEKKNKRARSVSLATINWLLLPTLIALLVLVLPLINRRQDSLVTQIREGNVSRARNLLQRGATADERGFNQTTALMVAARDHHADLARQLLSHGADVNAVDGDGDSALFYAIRGGHVDLLKTLLNAGARVNQQNSSGESPLMLAVHRDQRECAQLLLSAGADVKARNHLGKTALSLATQEGLTEMIQLLKASGAGD